MRSAHTPRAHNPGTRGAPAYPRPRRRRGGRRERARHAIETEVEGRAKAARGEAPGVPGRAPAGAERSARGSLDLPRGVGAVFARELAAAFDSSIAYVATIAGLLVVSSLFMNEFFLTGKLDMTPFFDVLAPVLVLLLPAISMRTWSEDLRTRTFELWMTLPLAPAAVVLGKYLATLALLVVFLAGTLPIVAMLAWLGEPDLGRIASGYAGALALGALLLAIGQFASGTTADQIVAFLATAFAGFVLLASGDPRVVAVLDGLAPTLLAGTFLADHLSALPHYADFVRGTVSLAGVLYFAGLSAVFLALNVFTVEKSRT